MALAHRDDTLLIRKIRKGTVIDHIPAGEALTVLKILGLTGKEGFTIALVMNVPSKKLGKKDMVKVENRELSPEEVNKIALVAPTATINIIDEYKVIRKFNVGLPERIRGLIKCMNPTCITRKENEHLEPSFRVISKQSGGVILQCEYCGSLLYPEDIKKQLTGRV